MAPKWLTTLALVGRSLYGEPNVMAGKKIIDHELTSIEL